MSEAGWRRIEEVFHRAADIPHEARAGYLDKACAGDETLRREVESLLAHESENGSTFAGPGGSEIPRGIAHYRISGELGRGGMGTVYRATDTKLGREVAIKILPANFARDPDRLARFTREARVLASLNHPNIAAVYGIEDRAIVMELVEGVDLKGPLPLDTALKYFRQIADGLDAAHQRGITHRDLKPANIKVTPQGVVKILDFGLAKASRPTVSAVRSAASPPVSATATTPGMILGTPAYMSPEQARGGDVDKRADIWAFGVIVWEIITGRRLFAGEAVSDVLATVLKTEPDLAGVPAPVRGLVSACLEKDPSRRLRDIGDWERLLESAPERTRASVFPWIPWSVAACLVLAAALAFWGPWRRAEQAEQPFRQLDIDVDDVFNTPAISPDGQIVAFVQNDQLAVRRLDQTKSVFLPGTQGSWLPFFSPDSRWIAFFARGKLRKISVDGDSLQTVCDASNGRGGAWVEGGWIVFSPDANSSLRRVPAAGGQPEPLTTLTNESAAVGSHRWVSPLPGGRFLYTAFKYSGLPSSIRAMSLNGGPGKTLIEEGADAHYVRGRLFYYRLGAIYAQPFDLKRLEATGPPVPVATGVAYNSITGPAFAVAADGTLIYRRGPSGITKNIAWLDAKGRFEILTETPGGYIEPRLSPDGKQLAFALDEEGKRSVWTLDLERRVMRQVARGALDQDSPIWTPDGRRLVFRSGQTLAWTQSDGSSAVETIQTDDRGYAPEDFSPDGRWLLFSRPAASGFALWRAKMQFSGEKLSLAEPRPIIEQDFEPGARISPDGQWIAYQNLEAQRRDGFVIPFSPEGPLGSRKLLSAETRIYPVWSRRRNEMYWRDYGGHFYVALWSAAGGEFQVKPGSLWTDQTVAGMQSIPMYDVAPDGTRLIVMLQVPEPAPDRHLHILLNINEELSRRAAKASGTK